MSQRVLEGMGWNIYRIWSTDWWLDPKKELRDSIVEEVQSHTEEHKLIDIFSSIRDLSFFQSFSDECREKNCENPASTGGYCRLHYISNWKTIKKNEAILVEGKLQDFIEEIIKKYSVKEVEGIIEDLSDEKSFLKALKEMDIESGDDDIDFNEELITISGFTSGLKRVKGKTDHIPHKVPITKEIKTLLLTAKKYSTSEEYVFSPITHSRYPHIDPEAPNNYIRKIGMRNQMIEGMKFSL